MQLCKAPNKRRPHLKKKYIYIYIYNIYQYILITKKKKKLSFYWSIKCIKKTPLYPKIQKIKKEKNKYG